MSLIKWQASMGFSTFVIEFITWTWIIIRSDYEWSWAWILLNFLLCPLHICSDYDSEFQLRYVRIYFYATTFDRITKDRAAKFVDMLSAIGGTMGLLTGFSLISAVEIVYFGIKIILQSLKKWKKNNQPRARTYICPYIYK